MATLNERGHEVVSDEPRALPLKFRRQSFVEQMQAFIRAELSRQAQDQDAESWEEADDFDVGDDPELSSPYELSADQEYYVPPEPAPEPAAEPAPGAASEAKPADGGEVPSPLAAG